MRSGIVEAVVVEEEEEEVDARMVERGRTTYGSTIAVRNRAESELRRDVR